MSTGSAPAALGSSPAARLSASWAAYFLCVLSLGLLALALLIVLIGRSKPLPDGFFPQWDGHLVNIIGATGGPILGGLIIAQRPTSRYGWLWSAFGLSYAILLLTQGYLTYRAATGEPMPEAGLLLAVAGVSWLGVFASISQIILLFPDGKLPSRRWRIVVWAVLAALVAGGIASPFVPGESGIVSIENPLGIESGAGRIAEAIMYAGVFVIFSSIVASGFSLGFRFRVASRAQRQQIKWFAYATVLYGATIILTGFLGREFPGIWHEVVQSVALAGLYTAIGVAIFKHQLYDIDLVINRTVVYAILTACVVGIYILVVGYIGALFVTDDNLLVSLVATGIIAVVFQPLRERVQQGINRLMFGQRDEPYLAISRLGERLGGTLEPGAVLPTIVETVREALKLPYAAIALPGNDGYDIAACSGAPSGEPMVVPLTYSGETVGQLLLAPRSGEHEFSPLDARLVQDLARHAGVAVHGARALNDLRRSREDLILAREEERRQLRRDLHDDLAPTLAALSLNAATVGELIPTDPQQAAEANNALRAAIRATVGDVRRLIYDLRPAALDDLGLVESIRDRASRLMAITNELQINVIADNPLPPLPAAVEVATYRIVQEALTNVSRHSGARNCLVQIACIDDRHLHVEITDDGIGLPDRPRTGVGLASMRERSAELGGSCRMEAIARNDGSPCGTRITVKLPLGDQMFPATCERWEGRIE